MLRVLYVLFGMGSRSPISKRPWLNVISDGSFLALAIRHLQAKRFKGGSATKNSNNGGEIMQKAGKNRAK